MKVIQNPSQWYRFLTEIKRGPRETEPAYLQRVKNCLIAFHDKYVGKRFLDNSQLLRIYGDFPPSHLTGRESEYMEYKYFMLRRKIRCLHGEHIFEGNGRFYAQERIGDPTFSGKTGIVSFVGNIDDGKQQQRKEDLDFIKALWRRFDYNP